MPDGRDPDESPGTTPRGRVLVFSITPEDRYRAGRTLRAFQRAGLPALEAHGPGREGLAAHLTTGEGPVWLVRAGSWPRDPAQVALPAPSATGRPLFALGAVVPEPERSDGPGDGQAAWAGLLARTGGDLSRVSGLPPELPAIASVYLEDPLVRELGRRLSGGEEIFPALRALAAGARARAVRFAGLDVRRDPALRVAQVITSLQQGGAERLVLGLMEELPRRGVRPLLINLGMPKRLAFPAPREVIDVSTAREPGRRITAAAEAALDWAADLVHAHLLSAQDLQSLSGMRLPVLVTAHNVRPSWPAGFQELGPGDAVLLVACSLAVEADVREAGLPQPVRTVWNGIDFQSFRRTPALLRAARRLRRGLGIGKHDFLVLVVANPRPQKRLDRLPAIVEAARLEFLRRGVRREVRLLIAGGPCQGDREAAGILEAISGSPAGRAGQVRLAGSVEDVRPYLAAADALVSASGCEGLSLAQLEALAMDVPVVAASAGGTAEAARGNPALLLLPREASPDEFGQALAGIAIHPPAGGREAASVHFNRGRTAEGYSRLYPRVVEGFRGPRAGEGILLVTNNFSTGGAQSSALRLLGGLAAEGIRVRAAVLEEEAAYPTPGRRRLAAAGVPVAVLPPPPADPAEAARLLLEEIDRDPPRAVLLWNALAEFKLLLADGLLDIPLFDVSPGEMYYASLERYFSRPRPGLPYLGPADYGARLAGVIVKYHGEAGRAAEVLKARVVVIPNGIPLGGEPAERPRRGRLVLGTAARLSPQKRLEDLIAALSAAQRRLPPYLLRIAGGAARGCEEYAGRLRELSRGLPVEFAGEQEDIRPFLEDLDLFLMISEPAGCPNASLEAMAAGLPVVATDRGGASEQVEDGVTGRLVPPGDPEAFAEALVELARDDGLRARLGAAARRRAAERFDLRRMVCDYRRVCLEGAAPAGPPTCGRPRPASGRRS